MEQQPPGNHGKQPAALQGVNAKGRGDPSMGEARVGCFPLQTRRRRTSALRSVLPGHGTGNAPARALDAALTKALTSLRDQRHTTQPAHPRRREKTSENGPFYRSIVIPWSWDLRTFSDMGSCSERLKVHCFTREGPKHACQETSWPPKHLVNVDSTPHQTHLTHAHISSRALAQFLKCLVTTARFTAAISHDPCAVVAPCRTRSHNFLTYFFTHNAPALLDVDSLRSGYLGERSVARKLASGASGDVYCLQ